MRSKLYLKKLDCPPATILQHLFDRFPQIAKDVWRERIAEGRVIASDGAVISEDTPYRHGVFVFYEKDFPDEPVVEERAAILFRNSEILAVDKPHGIPVTPGGPYIERSLLAQMRRVTDNPELTPLHRLDRDTAGVVLFSIKPASRGIYHALFERRVIEREYLAVAQISGKGPRQNAWRLETQITGGSPWYRQRIGPGPANAWTSIEFLHAAGGLGLFRLRPETGKKHQLRLHMAHIGFPILGDDLYSEPSAVPLQLLCRELAFQDPLTGQRLCLRSRLILAAASEFPTFVVL